MAPKPIRELRELCRYRKALLHERGREVQRLHQLLEDTGIKLGLCRLGHSGVSGRAMLEALVGGTHDPAVLAELANGVLRKKLPALREALEGRVAPHHLTAIDIGSAARAGRPCPYGRASRLESVSAPSAAVGHPSERRWQLRSW